MFQHHLDEAARKAVLQNGGYVLPSGAVLRRDPAKAPPVGAVPVPDFKQGVVEAVQAVLSRLRYREDIVCQTTVSPASAQSLPVTGGRVGIAFNGIAAATFYTWRVVRNGGAIDDNLPAHEGNNRADRDTLVVDVSILMPTLSDDCYLTRAHANRLVGYWLHEIGHALFTDATAFSAAAKEGVALRHFTNALEDARQEGVMCNSGVAPNARPVFQAMIETMLANTIQYGTLPDPKSAPWVAAVLGRLHTWGFDRPAMVAEMRRHVNPAILKVLEKYAPEVATCQDTKAVVRLARKIVDALRAIPDADVQYGQPDQPEPPVPPKPEPGTPQPLPRPQEPQEPQEGGKGEPKPQEPQDKGEGTKGDEGEPQAGDEAGDEGQEPAGEPQDGEGDEGEPQEGGEGDDAQEPAGEPQDGDEGEPQEGGEGDDAQEPAGEPQDGEGDEGEGQGEGADEGEDAQGDASEGDEGQDGDEPGDVGQDGDEGAEGDAGQGEEGEAGEGDEGDGDEAEGDASEGDDEAEGRSDKGTEAAEYGVTGAGGGGSPGGELQDTGRWLDNVEHYDPAQAAEETIKAIEEKLADLPEGAEPACIPDFGGHVVRKVFMKEGGGRGGMSVAEVAARVQKLRDSLPKGFNAIGSRLARLLANPAQWGAQHRQEAGRFNARDAHRAMAGVPDVFSRRWEKPGVETVVGILIDGSSSMSRGNIEVCKQLALVLTRCLQTMAVKHAIWTFHNIGFAGPQWNKDGDNTSAEEHAKIGAMERMRDVNTITRSIHKAARMGAGNYMVREKALGQRRRWPGLRPASAEISYRTHGSDAALEQRRRLGGDAHAGFEACALETYRDWNTPPKLAEEGISRMSAFGGTPDFAGVMAATQEILSQKAERRVLLVMTDGEGTGPDALTFASRFALAKGVEVIGIGIGHDVAQCYETSIKVDKIEDLTGRVLDVLIRQVETRRRTKGR